MEAVFEREIQLEGSVNFRDLGGLPTSDGRTVRTGMVYRSDALHRLTAPDLERLAAFRILTLLDLRSDRERTISGVSPLEQYGTRVVHCPVMSDTTRPEDVDMSLPMEFMYARFLKQGTTVYKSVFTALATEDHLPTVIHCAAGKDRTGVTVALLLRVLGVSDETIAEDYGMTDRNMERLKARLLQEMPVDQQVPKYPPHVMRALPETMTAFLAALDTEWGSAEEFLGSAGITPSQLDDIRTRLVVS